MMMMAITTLSYINYFLSSCERMNLSLNYDPNKLLNHYVFIYAEFK